jgi:phosphatidylethanolamine/phosphatidyl-N-methylethanolamine N-methyltransferase
MTSAAAVGRIGTVERLYERLAPVYDLVYGLGLHHGRRLALARLAPAAGERICEVGVGTGLSALGYPRDCRVVGLDLSAAMLQRARKRIARRARTQPRLCRMDAGRLAFPDGQFDAVYAAYVINVVADPIAVARELARVCRPGGRLVLLNHFADGPGRRGRVDRWLGRVATRLGGTRWDIDIDTVVRGTGLVPSSVEPVNAGVSTLLVCHKP